MLQCTKPAMKRPADRVQILSSMAQPPRPNPKKRKRENCDTDRPLQQMPWEPNKRRLLGSGAVLHVSASPWEWDDEFVRGSGLKPFTYDMDVTMEVPTDGDAITNEDLMLIADAFKELEEAMELKLTMELEVAREPEVAMELEGPMELEGAMDLEGVMDTYTITKTATVSMVMDLDTSPSQTTTDNDVDMEFGPAEAPQEERAHRFIAYHSYNLRC